MWQMKMKRLSQSFLILITMILVACGPATNQVVIPPDQLGTAIVETSAALASQTALYAPPIQFVASDTAVPTMVNTDLPTMTLLPTYTSFLVIVPSNTATITPTKTATETPLATKTLNQPCVVAAQIPANNTQFTTGAFFDSIWTLVNTGAVTWAAGNVDFAFSSGTKMYLNGVTLLDSPEPKCGFYCPYASTPDQGDIHRYLGPSRGKCHLLYCQRDHCSQITRQEHPPGGMKILPVFRNHPDWRLECIIVDWDVQD
jgi:hypothetical protein